MPMSTVCAGQHLRREAADARQLRRLRAEQRRERHAVDVAAAATSPACSCRRARRPRCRPSGVPRRGGRTRPSPRPTRRRGCDRRRARAASRPSSSTRERRLVEPSRRPWRCRGCISCAGRRASWSPGIGATRSPSSTTVTPSAVEPLAEAGDPKRRRPHVDAAAVAAEIERHADDVDRAASRVAELYAQRRYRLTASALNIG